MKGLKENIFSQNPTAQLKLNYWQYKIVSLDKKSRLRHLTGHYQVVLITFIFE